MRGEPGDPDYVELNQINIHALRAKELSEMLRAYARPVIDAINACREVNTFIPALAYTFAASPARMAPVCPIQK